MNPSRTLSHIQNILVVQKRYLKFYKRCVKFMRPFGATIQCTGHKMYKFSCYIWIWHHRKTIIHFWHKNLWNVHKNESEDNLFEPLNILTMFIQWSYTYLQIHPIYPLQKKNNKTTFSNKAKNRKVNEKM